MTNPQHNAFFGNGSESMGLTKLEYAAMHAPPMPLGADLRPDLAEELVPVRLPPDLTDAEKKDHECWRDAGCDPETPRIIAFAEALEKQRAEGDIIIARNECRRHAVWAATYAKMLMEELNRP